ncbi:hypothetical protein ACW5CM_14015 [Microbacterium sp. A588]
MTTKTRIRIATISILAGAVLLIGGASGGYAIAAHTSPIVYEASTTPVPCNLRLVWDRVEQDYLAVYEESAMVSYTGDYGRIANLSCTDADILEWQQHRRVNDLDAEVCRPVLDSSNVAGNVFPIGCAVPTMVVTGEPR